MNESENGNDDGKKNEHENENEKKTAHNEDQIKRASKRENRPLLLLHFPSLLCLPVAPFLCPPSPLPFVLHSPHFLPPLLHPPKDLAFQLGQFQAPLAFFGGDGGDGGGVGGGGEGDDDDDGDDVHSSSPLPSPPLLHPSSLPTNPTNPLPPPLPLQPPLPLPPPPPLPLPSLETPPKIPSKRGFDLSLLGIMMPKHQRVACEKQGG